MPIKIIDLPAEEAPTDDDFIVIRDNLTGTTRKVTRAVFFTNPPIPDGAITAMMIGDGQVEKRHLGEDAKIGVRTYMIASPGTLTPNIKDYDAFVITAANSNITIAAPTGATPLDRQGMLISIKDNGTARSISFNAIYQAIGVTLPNTTVANKLIYINARYNAQQNKWDVLGVARQA